MTRAADPSTEVPVTVRTPPGDTPDTDAELRLRTADGVGIAALHLPPGQAAVAPGTVVVLAHGFTGAVAKPDVRRIAEVLRRRCGVLAIDLRGHGRSGGLCTMGDAEVLDVDAAVAAARALGYTRVATLGFSMGGSVVLRHAGLLGVRTREPVDAVASVSSPSRWYRTESAPMRRLHWLVTTGLGRWVGAQGFDVRIDPAGWVVEPTPPIGLVDRIAPTPLLVVHGDRDAFLAADNGPEIAAAAGPAAELWELAGFGHAEVATDDALAGRLGNWLVSSSASASAGGGQ